MANPLLPKNPFELKNPLDVAKDVAQQAQQLTQQAVDTAGLAVGGLFSPLMKFQQAFFESCIQPDRLPPGAQDPFAETSASIKKPPPGTNPIVLVHGTFANRHNAWRWLAPELNKEGLAVFAINYGLGGAMPKVVRGCADIRGSAKELAKFVDEVLSKTGASKVDLVGHSQGAGILPRWYLKYEGGKDKVDKLIGIAPSNHGVHASGMATLVYMFTNLLRVQNLFNQGFSLAGGPAVLQQFMDSNENLNPQLDEGGDTLAGVNYTVMMTWRDEIITPNENARLRGAAGHRFTNTAIQDYEGFKYDQTEHLGAPNHPVVCELVKRALAGKSLDPKEVLVPIPPMFFTP